jgi:hypothetical protein
MRKSAAIAHYGSPAAIAKVLGISRTAVHNWGERVPLASARALEILTGAALFVDESMYEELARAEQVVAEQAEAGGAQS